MTTSIHKYILLQSSQIYLDGWKKMQLRKLYFKYLGVK